MENNPERIRLEQAERREEHWKRWGPYLSARSWGTVREDYSPDGDAWNYFPHDHARSRAYRWTEDGIAGISDNHQRLCFALAMWNGQDPILKERMFGLTGPQGNHGEDVKECYYYLDSTPTHSYMKCLYKYPQAAFPYHQLLDAAQRLGREGPEFELLDTGVFEESRYFDVFAEYAKAFADDILIRVTVVNRGPDSAPLLLLPTLWFRNTWSWGIDQPRPALTRVGEGPIDARHDTLGAFSLFLDGEPDVLFTENDTNVERLFQNPRNGSFFKDGFHDYFIQQNESAVNPEPQGTKACGVYELDLAPGETRVLHFQLKRMGEPPLPADEMDGIFATRIQEADQFYGFTKNISQDACNVQRQGFAGMCWNKQFYHFVIEDWLKGDPGQPPPPASRKRGRDAEWIQLFNEDIISMPDDWEYPWYAAWDLAFHMITFAVIDPDFAKDQLSLFLREWYMHPNGQLPAYEWAFSDVNPPVHAWACWRVYKIDAKLKGEPDREFLESVFHKLLMNFTWWVNRKDSAGNNIFEGGFLGLDNIGVFDRSAPLPTGGYIEQSDGTSWMAMYCLNMLKIAMELAIHDSTYEDIASKFFEHFLYITDAMNNLGEGGLWDESDGFFYDNLRLPTGEVFPLKVRSMVGLIPLFAVDTLEQVNINRLPGFKKRMEWFFEHRPHLCKNIVKVSTANDRRLLLSVVPRERLERIIQTMLSEEEFLTPFGIRSLSKYHKDHPYKIDVDGNEYRVDYEPAESRTGLFGGNSNWRGPIWFPLNFLLIESLQRYHHYFGEDLKAEFPTGSGKQFNLWDIAAEISRSLSHLFLRGEDGTRPVFGPHERLQNDPNFRDYIIFSEYFNGDTGEGLGASHQTGWTGLVSKLIQQSGDRPR